MRAGVMNAVGNVLLVGADPEFRAWVGDLLSRIGYSVSHASSGEEALEAVRGERPHCLVLEVLLPGITGYAVCQEVRRLHGEDVSIIFVSAERTEVPDRVAGLLLGADDYIVKPFHHDEFLARIRRAVDRARHLLRVAGAAPAGLAELTAREREVLALLAEGRDQADIAVELFISPTTVSTHIQRILGKLGVHSRAQAVAVAHLERLVERPVVKASGSVGTKPSGPGKVGSHAAEAGGYDFLVPGEAPAPDGNQGWESDRTADSSEAWWLAADTAHARVSATTGELTYVTPEWAKLMLDEASDVVGRHFMDFVAPEARTEASGLFDLVRKVGELRSQALVRRGDGSTLMIELRAVATGDTIDVAFRSLDVGADSAGGMDEGDDAVDAPDLAGPAVTATH
jgi:DNA-binding NarL/FixJ family response regulator